jgi:hypothetical protein
VENKAPPQGAIRLFRQNTKRHARARNSPSIGASPARSARGARLINFHQLFISFDALGRLST